MTSWAFHWHLHGFRHLREQNTQQQMEHTREDEEGVEVPAFQRPERAECRVPMTASLRF